MGFEFGQVAELRDKVKEFRIASGRVHDKIARRVALLTIRKVKLMTPVDTGDLRNNWQFQVVKKGDVYVIVIFNQVEYASFVESGHRIVVAGRTVGWVEGRFMLKLTMNDLESIAPRMWEREIEREMRRIFGQ